jgi:hypothetical protein
MLRDAEKGPLILAEVRRLRPETTDAELEAARSGSIADVWRFFLKAKPRPPNPPKTALRLVPSGTEAEVGYMDVHGTERVVILRKQDGRWRIDYLPL